MAGLFQVGRLTDLLSALPHEDLVRRVDHADHGLIAHDVFQRLGPPSRLLDGFPQRRVCRVLALVDDAAGEFPTELLRHEAVPPHHQDAVLIINDGGDCHVVKSHDVVLEPLHSRGLYVPELEFDPSVVVHVALAVDAPGFQPFRALHAHRTRNPVRTPAANLQLALRDETGEHLP